ncbi:dihydrofolate reductase family protein [Mumia quercus]|uniref:dihydrofolate reductase family protein n=1 Tax=Mumia quercus TaxID=2976125 RepID=UPI0021CEB23A|nr:dihydrofolate reductase family protein [Mumia quercus]
MPKLRAFNIGMSLDGFVAGVDQSLEEPLGVGGEELHTWMFDDPKGVDADFVARRTQGVGATVMGRNMFGPIRGEWPDDRWKGWWGDDPPYHHPVFVLTHHARDPVEMQGGTTWNFVTDGIESALAQAYEAADGRDVALGGGASTLRQFLEAGLLDDLHVAVAPVVLGGGERLFTGPLPAGYGVIEHVPSDAVTHVRIGKVSASASS